MKIDNKKEIKKHLKDAYLIKPENNENLKATIFEAKELLLAQSKYKYTRWNLCILQFKSISKLFWLLQFMCFSLFVLRFPNANNMDSIQIIFLTVSPIMAFYLLPELYKSQIYNMAELEATCFNIPAKTTGIKLMLTSISNIVVILIMSLILGIYHQLNIWEILFRGLIPFNVAVAITLVFFGIVRVKSPYAMVTVAIIFSLVLSQFREVGAVISACWTSIYLISLLGVIVLLCMTICRLNKVEGYYYGA